MRNYKMVISMDAHNTALHPTKKTAAQFSSGLLGVRPHMPDLYQAARAFLLERIPDSNPSAILAEYLGKPDESADTADLSELYRRLLLSAQNANMKAGVIGGSIGGFNNLGPALFNFNPVAVGETFRGSPEQLLKHIRKVARPRGKIRTASLSIWPKYCKTILSSSAFLTQFKDGDDFRAWANHLYSDERTMAALPLILSEEVEGIGYALACDFLKELGYFNYGKPDVHVREIFSGLGLCPATASPYQTQRVITRIASVTSATPYDVDKVFWLIGSGKFYKHPQLGKGGRVARMKKEFLSTVHGGV